MHTFRSREQGAQTREEPASRRFSVRELAHELNSLLDGSLRSLRLAERALADAEAAEDATTGRALDRLRTARGGMEDIARVLGRAMSDRCTGAALLASARTLGQEVERAIAIVGPAAEAAAVDLEVDLHPAVVSRPASALGAVLVNGLRNAIEATATGDRDVRRVALRVFPGPDHAVLTLVVTDTGPGLPEAGGDEAPPRAGGHGIGLTVCRAIVGELGGTLTLTNADAGVGAVLRVEIPREEDCIDA